MCPGCILAGSAFCVMWGAGKLLTFRAQRRIARDMAAVDGAPEASPTATSPTPTPAEPSSAAPVLQTAAAR